MAEPLVRPRVVWGTMNPKRIRARASIPEVGRQGPEPGGSRRLDTDPIDCIAVLKALSEVNRMRILRLLLKRRLCVGEIVRHIHLSQYAVSRHLRVLRDAGLVEVEKQGKRRLYAVAAHLSGPEEGNSGTLELGCCRFRFDRLPR